MSSRNPFSKLKKKLKRQLARGRHEPEAVGAVTDGGSEGSSSLPRPEPHLTTHGGHNHPQPGNETDADEARASSTDPLPHSDDPGFVPVSEGGRDGGGGEVFDEGREVDEKGSHLRSGVEGVESGPSQEGKNFDEEKVDPVNPSPSEGMEAVTTGLSLPATASLDNTDGPAVPDHAQQVPTDEREPGAADGDTSNWKSAASATARSLLYTVKESSNAYAPLKSIAEGLYFILNNCEVCHPSCTFPDAYGRSSTHR